MSHAKLPNQEMAALWNGASGRPGWTSRRCSTRCIRPSRSCWPTRSPRAVRARYSTSAAAPAAPRWPSRAASARADMRRHRHLRAADRRWRARARSARAWPQTSSALTRRRTPSTPASFDMMISRFGVMFFDDPVAAFANLRRALDATPARCRLRGVPVDRGKSVHDDGRARRGPDAAGHTAAQTGRARAIRVRGSPTRAAHSRETAGWSGVELAPIDVECAFPARALERFFTRLGPVGQALRRRRRGLREQREPDGSRAFTALRRRRGGPLHRACWIASQSRRPQSGGDHSARAAHREPVDAQRGLAHAHRHALPFLAAGADAVVELEIVAHHRHAREHVGAVADERGALDAARRACRSR